MYAIIKCIALAIIINDKVFAKGVCIALIVDSWVVCYKLCG